jgi:hypothetical protein
MAQKVSVELVDDITGESDGTVATVEFGLDGVTYEIDVNEDNAAALRRAFADVIGAARRTGGRAKRGTGAIARSAGATNGSSPRIAGAQNKERNKAVREWANNNGYSVSDRGRISAEIQEAYDAAQAAPAPARRGGARRSRVAKPSFTAS